MAEAIANTTPTRSNLGYSSNRLVLSLFFFSSVLLMQMPKGNAALAPEEESILQVLRQRYKLPDWRGDACDISWITCSNGSQVAHVEAIDLNNRYLTGKIPADVAKLRHIKNLNLTGNELQGPIPDLSNMTNLTNLDLSYNKLCGRILDTSAFTNISTIYLGFNDLSGGIPASLFQHPSMRVIDLSGNFLLGGPLPDMSDLIKLQVLDLSGTDINGSIPESINKLAQALEIRLGGNRNLKGTIPNLCEMVALQSLDVGSCGLSGLLPGLEGSTSLSYVNLADNDFSGCIPCALFEHPTLRSLELHNNFKLSGEIPDMSQMINVETLNLTSNNFSGSISKEIGRLKNLISLDLRNNLFDGIVPEALASLRNLTTLRLENNRFSAIPEALIQKYNNGQIYLTYDNNAKIIRAESDLSTGAIVGIVIANGVLVSVLGLVLYYMISTRNSKLADKLSREDMPKSSRAFTLKQIKAVTANNKTLIGKGGFGQVYHGKLPDGKEVAVKVRAVDSKQGTPEFLNEVRLLSRLHHRNLVPLVGYCQEAQQQILVYQYMAQGTLHKHLYHTGSNSSVTNSLRPPSYQPLDWKTRLDIAINAARGLEYLHKDCNPPVIHRDVKTANILLTENLQAKVGDLGISKQTPELDLDEVHNISGISTAIKGTFGYLDPEYFVRRKLTTKSDVYSFGVVLLEIITGRRPQSDSFPNSAETNLIDWVRDAVSNNEVDSVVDDALRGEYKMDCMLKVARTALSCVSPSGAKRPDMGEIVHILIEALQMEGQYIETSTPSTEITVLFSGPMNPPLFSRSASRHEHSSQSYEALRHPSWNTDPR